jgi:hypothetical protein
MPERTKYNVLYWNTRLHEGLYEVAPKLPEVLPLNRKCNGCLTKVVTNSWICMLLPQSEGS